MRDMNAMKSLFLCLNFWFAVGATAGDVLYFDKPVVMGNDTNFTLRVYSKYRDWIEVAPIRFSVNLYTNDIDSLGVQCVIQNGDPQHPWGALAGSSYAVVGQNYTDSLDPRARTLYLGHGGVGMAGVLVGTHASNPSEGAGVVGSGSSGYVLQYGVVGQVVSWRVAGTNIAVAGAAQANNIAGTYIGGYFETTTGYSSPNPKYESAVLLADNRDSGLPIFVCRSNQTTVAKIDAAGRLTIPCVVLSGSTNQITFGGTAAAPVSEMPVRWVSVQVQGEPSAYRIPLYQ